MTDPYLEIKEYTGEGYQPLVDYGGWRVAHLNYLEGLHPDNNRSMERHLETDEVFVLVAGQALLLLGENGPTVERLTPFLMETGTVYNVKRSAWHTVVLSRDGRLVIVENQDTSTQNSQYCLLTPPLCAQIAAAARQAMPGCWD